MAFNIMDLFGPGAMNRLLQPIQNTQGIQNMLANPQAAPPMAAPVNVPQQQVAEAPQVDPWAGLREVSPGVHDPMQTAAVPQQGGVVVPDKPGGLDKYTRDIFRENLNQFFIGMASGRTPAESLSMGALAANAKHNDMKNANQTVAWLQSKGMDEEQAWQLASSPPALGEYLKSLSAGTDPMKALQLEKAQLEVANLRNPTAKNEDTALIRELKAAGLKEGTPEFQEAILANNRPKGMMIESDGQGGFKMVQGTDVSGGANMNVEQGKNTGFLLRAQDADKVISNLEDEGTSVWNSTAGRIPVVGNFLRGENAQKFDQAKRDFINAQLRQESGAVISPEEFSNAEVQYFPQPGDGPEVIEQKRQNRQNAISGFRIRSGPGAQSVDKMAGQNNADPLGIR